MKTPSKWPEPDSDEMRERYHMQQPAIDGTLHIRGLDDEQVLTAARDSGSDSRLAILAHMGADTNPDWIRARCAEEAYRRGLIGEREFDYLCD